MATRRLPSTSAQRARRAAAREHRDPREAEGARARLPPNCLRRTCYHPIILLLGCCANQGFTSRGDM
eukprot:2960928-Prymnesium_polylepis.2